MSPVTSVLWYAACPALTFAVLLLWSFGMLDIDRHRRRGSSTSAGLLCMAGCVSLVAIVAVASIGALFADPWVETVASTTYTAREAGEHGAPTRSPIFSFGLENASHATVVPADEAGANR